MNSINHEVIFQLELSIRGSEVRFQMSKQKRREVVSRREVKDIETGHDVSMLQPQFNRAAWNLVLAKHIAYTIYSLSKGQTAINLWRDIFKFACELMNDTLSV